MKITRFEHDKFVTYEFHSRDALKEQIEKWKEEFRYINHTDRSVDVFGVDDAYHEYCVELDELMEQFKEESIL